MDLVSIGRHCAPFDVNARPRQRASVDMLAWPLAEPTPDYISALLNQIISRYALSCFMLSLISAGAASIAVIVNGRLLHGPPPRPARLL
eukprot:1261879-Pyramimonas_sp.AAC.1